MQNNQGTIGLPYESIYDEILAKATSSQHGYTDEEVNNVLKEMQERYHKRYPGERYDLYFHDIAFPNQPWLAESWAWIHLCMQRFGLIIYLDTDQAIVPGEPRPWRLSNHTEEESGYYEALNRHAVCLYRATSTATQVAHRVGDSASVLAQQWDTEPVVKDGSEMNAEPTLGANDDIPRKRSMPNNEEARKKVKTKKDMQIVASALSLKARRNIDTINRSQLLQEFQSNEGLGFWHDMSILQNRKMITLANVEEVGTTAVTIREQSFPTLLNETCSVSHIRRGNALVESFGLGGMMRLSVRKRLWKRGVEKV